MRFVKPEVYVVAETKTLDYHAAPGIVSGGMNEYLEAIGGMAWQTDAKSDSEKLAEFMGRLCYNSFAPGLNPNVTRIREGNKVYLENILKEAHGSVLEHATVTFVFHNVSRVFTHELVRHRVGVAISQESLRYVRLSDLKVWLPNMLLSHKGVAKIVEEVWRRCETGYAAASQILGLDDEKSFSLKKKWTSALRRMAPIGLATTIGWTVNLRTLRHVLEKRSHRSAEEECRYVFGIVGKFAQHRYPAMFGDYKVEEVDGEPEFTTVYGKV